MSTSKLKAIAFFCLSCSTLLHAGTVTTYPPGIGIFNNIAIKPDGNVIFTAKGDQGTVTLDQTSLGCSFQHGTSSYGGTGSTATADVTFTDDATGNDNSCTIVVNHTSPGLGSLTDQCAQEDPFVFNIMVPTVNLIYAYYSPQGSTNAYINGTYLECDNSCAWHSEVQVQPSDAVSSVNFQTVQDMQGTTTANNRPPATGGMKISVPSAALDGTWNDEDPEGGYVFINSTDSPQAKGSASTFYNQVINYTFTDYLQYQIENGSSMPWNTIEQGQWTWNGTITSTASGGSYTPGGSTDTLDSGFSSSTAPPNLTPADKSSHSF